MVIHLQAQQRFSVDCDIGALALEAAPAIPVHAGS